VQNSGVNFGVNLDLQTTVVHRFPSAATAPQGQTNTLSWDADSCRRFGSGQFRQL